MTKENVVYAASQARHIHAPAATSLTVV